MKKKFKYDVKRPPIYGHLNIEQFEKLVDHDSFPKCESCEQPIYNPEFYEDPEVAALGLCGPCCTGEADTIMVHEEDVDWARYA